MTTTASALARASWRALGVQVDLLVDDSAALDEGRALLEQQLDELDRACSRFRDDSELVALPVDGTPVPVGPVLADAVTTALQAAAVTDGDVDPTLGAELVALGYDRDLAALPADGPPPRVRLARTASWTDVELTVNADGGLLRLPPGVRLDLGATAKARAADRAAEALSAALDCGVLVNLGGDLAVAGPAPDGGWPVRVQDRPWPLAAVPDGPSQVVAVHRGGLATSSTTARRWKRGGSVLHHLLDPRRGTPVRSPWRTVSAAAADCVTANTFSTAAVVRGEPALAWLSGRGVAARLVRQDGTVVRTPAWPGE